MSATSPRLSEGERVLLDRYSEELTASLGSGLWAVWLFGSRARGEDTGEYSDVDLLVLVDDDAWDRKVEIRTLLHRTAREVGLEDAAWSFSVHVHTPEWLRERREIRSFFINEVDRDKVVIAGRL